MSGIETAKAGGLPATDRAAMPLAARPVTVAKKRTRIGGAAGVRACANLSRARIAERMNTARTAIARPGSGNAMPSTGTLRKIAKTGGARA